jgi:hypothetical protein
VTRFPSRDHSVTRADDACGMEPARGPITFILRLTPDLAGRLRGVVVRVSTGEQSRFEGIDKLAEVLGAAISREAHIAATTGHGAPGAGAEQQREEEQPWKHGERPQ